MDDKLNHILHKYHITDTKSPINIDDSRWVGFPNLITDFNLKIGAEIGVERGLFSKRICRLNPQLKLYGIDIWQWSESYRQHVPQERLESFYNETVNRMKPYNYQIIRDWSLNASKKIADNMLDFVYIDASHDYENVKKDLAAWVPKVKSGGIVAGHDYIDTPTCGVIQAVNEWVDENKIDYLFIFKQERCPSWFYIKK